MYNILSIGRASVFVMPVFMLIRLFCFHEFAIDVNLYNYLLCPKGRDFASI
jgi:hypothetical protein